MQEIVITFNNNEKKYYDKPVKLSEVANYYQSKTNLDILGAKINNEIVPMEKIISKSCKVDFIDITDPYGYRMYQGALKFIFEVAIKDVYNNSRVNFLHSVPKGIMAEIIIDKKITKDDVNKIKEAMSKIISSDLPFLKYNVLKKDAIKYFINNKELEKASNIHNITNEIVNIYRLKNIYNYFYTELTLSTKVINKFDLKLLDSNKIVILYPSARTNGNVPEYVHYENIIETFNEGLSWLNTLKVPYLSNLNELISNGKIENLIASNELIFNEKIAEVARHINNNKDIKIILLSGPSSSGKTTTCKRLSSYLEAIGYNTIRISIDDYYKDDEEMIKENIKDFETIDAIDTNMLNEDIKNLLAKKEIKLSNFDFISRKKSRINNAVKLEDNSIILIEGLHALNNEIAKDIPDKYKYKIYLSPFISLRIDRHNYISTVDLRLLRRIIRDSKTRGTNPARTIEFWQTVRDGEEKYIFPFIHQADVVINTSYVFEIGVLKVFAEPLLYGVGLDSPYYEEARRLINFLKEFYPISSEYIGKDSILREFIG